MTYSLEERLQAYIKVAGIFVPTRYIWRPFRDLLEVDRCAVDGAIVTNSHSSLSRHLGHRMSQPVKISLWELFLIWFNIIE